MKRWKQKLARDAVDAGADAEDADADAGSLARGGADGSLIVADETKV